MRLLALETTEASGSVAALRDGDVVLEREIASMVSGDGTPTISHGRRTIPSANQRSAQALAPTIGHVLGEAGWKAADVDLVAVTVGPGSFTGLRIGVTTAKTFAFAAHAEVIGVGTMDAIAQRATADIEKLKSRNPEADASGSPSDGVGADVELLKVVIDAQRRQVFAATLRQDQAGAFDLADEIAIEDKEAWIARLTDGDVVTGPGLQRLVNQVPAGVRVLGPALWRPTATSVGLVARRMYLAGERHDLWGLVPRYHRPSAAEEKKDQPQGASPRFS